jgi:uncharacterized protein (UPF0276 family)
MDWRHKIASDVSSLKEIFSNKNFKMVLDLNHCYTNDPTMKLAADIYKEFKDIIKHCHLSGIQDHNNPHSPLYRLQIEIIVNAVPSPDLPIIIESGFEDLEDARKEAEYLRRELGISD